MTNAALRWSITALIGASLFAGFGTGAVAQELVEAPHPSHIHRGTCADLDPDVAYPLSDIAPVAPDAVPGAVEVGVSSAAISLDDLLAEPHAINVHESSDNAGSYIACGDITGSVADGTLVIGLGEQNGSGYSGVAAISSGNSETSVDVLAFLGFGLSGGAATADASPVAAEPVAATETAVSVLDYAFDAPMVEIPVGTTVTWSNDGGVIHTTTAADGSWDSGILSSGDSFSYTFEEAGTFEYVCTLHPTMIGTIVVTEP